MRPQGIKKPEGFLAQHWFELKKKSKLKFLTLKSCLLINLPVLKNARIKANKIPAPAQRQLYLDKLKLNEQHIQTRTAQLQRQKQLIKHKIMQLLATSHLKVNDLMHPGVELKIAKDTKQFSRIYPPHLVKLSEGKITQTF